MSDPPTDGGPSEKSLSPWSALLQVITEPTATFQALAERPAILPPYLLQMAAGVISTVLLLRLTLATIADQMAKTPDAPPIAMQIAKMSTMIVGPIVAAGIPWIVGALLALIASFFAQFQGGSVSFRSYLSMIGYARVPLAIGGVIQTALMATAPTLQQAQKMSLSLAVLAPEDTSVILKAFLSTVNPFDLFYYVLLAIGFGVIQRIKPARSAVFVGTIYVLSFVIVLASLAFSKSRGM